ncbi:MAG: hypothetical protein KKA22_04030 [Gammaproteobacteria bacterium]|nr:hypothetical protein [Gammaproteobacteria bacterium]MBU1407298.1 hypothetical protein [Gammaproteobacteria bacterium]MBU1531328.1 hypothetical protein [Gammaproteobacteria bacterium]
MESTTKPTAKPATAVKKPTTKAKPAPKAAPKAAKAAPAKPTPKAAPKAITFKPLMKPEDLTLRDGTWTRFMAVAALTSGSKEEAQKKIDASKEYAGRRVDMAWLVKKGYIK